MGGPAGCLQFFTGATGTVNTFNWATATTSKCLKSVNLQFNKVGRQDDDMIVPPSDGPMIIWIDWE